MSTNNGHDKEDLPGRMPGGLSAFMLSHLIIPKQGEPSQDSVKNDAAMKALTNAIGDPAETSYEVSYESRTSDAESEIAAVIKTMKETGSAHEEIKEVVAILANKHPPSYDNRTSLVRESDAELKARRKKEYDRKYQRERYQRLARDPESKILVRDENRDISIVSKVETLKGSKEEDKKESKRDSGIRARASYPDDFEKFWREYPRTPAMGKAETFAAWKKLPSEERNLAAAAVPKFKAWLKTQKPDYPVVHAVRFLSKKRFDGFQTEPQSKLGRLDIPPWEREGLTEAEYWEKERLRNAQS